MLNRILRSPNLLAFLVSSIAFVVYQFTLAPTVGFIDSGELAAVACTLGIAHPTGYPLFTLLGWIFAQLPIAGEEIVRLNMMAAFFCAAGVYVFFHVVRLTLGLKAHTQRLVGSNGEDGTSEAVLAASAAGALMLAFSETYWSQAVSIEVYSLHALFLGIVVYSFFRAVLFGEISSSPMLGPGRIPELGWWLLFAFTLGLSFTNHMTTILLAPACLFLYFRMKGFGSGSWKRIGMMVVPFVAGLSGYLYLPIRASQAPALNWGNPVTLERFLWHLGGKQYRVWIFSSTEAAGRQLKYFLTSLPGEFAYVGLLLGVIGLIALLRFHRTLGTSVLIMFVSCVFYSINYDIHDIDSYFLLAYFCVALCAGWGVFILFAWLQKRRVWRTWMAPGVAGLLAVMLLAHHYSRIDESRNYLVEDYTKNVFGSLKPNALILSYQWDYWLSASFYYQRVKNLRSDVIVVDKELLRRSWYLTSLERLYPKLIARSRMEVDAFGKELYKFEHDIPYNPAVIQGRFEEMIGSFVHQSLEQRPVYVTAEIEPEFTKGLQRVPIGLVQQLFADTAFHPSERKSYDYRPFDRPGRLEDMIKRMYANSMISRADYYYNKRGDRDEAVDCLNLALSYQKDSRDARSYLEALKFGRKP